VQLRTGANADSAELLAWATERISERAAVPKEIKVVDALPVTAVGKTFKPTLSMWEIESVIRSEADAAGAELAELTVEQDPKHGIVAHYRPADPYGAAAAELTESLGRYTFRSFAD